MSLTLLEQVRESNELLAWLRDQVRPGRDLDTDENYEGYLAEVQVRYVALMRLEPELVAIQPQLALVVDLAAEEPTEERIEIARKLTEKQNLLWRRALARNAEKEQG